MIELSVAEGLKEDAIKLLLDDIKKFKEVYAEDLLYDYVLLGKRELDTGEVLQLRIKWEIVKEEFSFVILNSNKAKLYFITLNAALHYYNYYPEIDD